MKLFATTFFLLCLAILAFAAEQPQRPVIVSYPEGTPASVLEEAKKAVTDAGGIITHDYHLIVAFAAKVPEKILDTISTMGASHNVLIEQDETVSINNKGS